MRTRPILLTTVLAVVLVGGCGDGDDDPTASSDAGPATGTTATTTATDVTVGLAENPLGGELLVDGDGMTLYVFDADGDGTSACTGDCATTWPPLTGDPVAGDGVGDGLLDTITRDDGSTQVTADGRPLYRYAGDDAPGDTRGQGIGGQWWAVDANGDAITTGEPDA